MGRAMAEAVPSARAVYDRASEALGFDLAEALLLGLDRAPVRDRGDAAGDRGHLARVPARA